MISASRLQFLRLSMAAGLFLLFSSIDAFAQLPNAWQITDNSAAAGSGLNYTTNLPPDLRGAATNVAGGFHLTVNARFVTNFAGPKAMAMAYGLGNKRFLVWFELDGVGDLTAELEGLPAIPLTGSGTGSALYHTHEIVYNPTNGTASYAFDGDVKVIGWTGSANALPSGQVYWGSGSSPGKGQMNFHSVNFQVTNAVVASYEAGTDGNPSVAPDPETQGWTISNGSPPSGAFVTDVSPDTDLLPTVITELPGPFTPGNAVLNGQVDPAGSATLAWFEWGSSPAYGNSTPPQSAGDGASIVLFSNIVELAGGSTCHYRAVASNTFGVMMGSNLSFVFPAFIKLDIPGLPGGVDSSVAWADYDRDGWLDFLFTRDDVSQVRRNTGGSFSDVTASAAPGLSGEALNSATWADYDNDGWLDFLLMGGSFGDRQFWRNTGGAFSNVTASVMPGLAQVENGFVAWADYDNDGRTDFLLLGRVSGTDNRLSQLWRNTESGFASATTNVAPGLAGVENGFVAWADFDNDGWQDFLLAGSTDFDGGIVSQLWKNTGGAFTNVTATAAPDLPAAAFGSAAWGDYDNDGWLDFLFTGVTSNGPISQIWRNTGGAFTNVTTNAAPGLPQVHSSSAAWADYDNDGQLDFLLIGLNSGGHISQLWRNTGGEFTNATETAAPDLPGVSSGSAAWADYDNDGRLDFLLAGMSPTGAVAHVWRNITTATNTAPTAPDGLSASISASAIANLSWIAPSDAQTPSPGLTYNLRVGTAPGSGDVISPSSLTNGFRMLPAWGNAQLRTNALLKLQPGTYYWSVQAIDSAFAGGPFSHEAVLVLPLPTLNARPTNGIVTISWEPSYPGWMLQETADLTPVQWSISASGPTNPAIVPATNSARYFRLFRP